MKVFLISVLAVLSLLPLSAGEHKSFPAEKVRLDNGLTIVANSPGSKKTAEKLSRILSRIYGKPFPVKSGSGADGIAVGVPAEFPDLAFRPSFDRNSIYEQQGFELKTHRSGIYLLGGGPLGAEYAAGELLTRLGWRWFMPSDRWEIFPADPPKELALHVREIPDYAARFIETPYDIHYAKWFSPAEKARKKEWLLAQRNGGFRLQTTHCFERFIKENRKTLDAHPEYLTLWKGKRDPSQLCFSDPGLRKLFVEWELAQLRKDPTQPCISVEPADNTHWCTCAGCRALGSPSTRIVGLANETVQAFRDAGFKGKKVAFYAYNAHCAPPAIKVDPDVIVSICTSFLLYGWTPDRLTAAWRKQGAVCGIREYYYPGQTPTVGRIARLAYAASTIPAFHRNGARYMFAEYSGHFGTCLPVIHTAFRLLWNVETKTDGAIRDLAEKAFPSAPDEMESFFRLLNGQPAQDMSEDLLARCYGLLDQARRKAAGNEPELQRLDDLTCYIRFAEMSYRTPARKPDQRLKQLQYLDSIRDTKLIYTYSAYRHQLRHQGQAACDKVGWKTHPAPDRAQVEQFIRDGRQNNKRLDFEAVSFSKELKAVRFPGADAAGKLEPVRNHKEYLLWSDGKPFEVTVTGGLISHYRNRGNVRAELIQIGGISDAGTMETVVCRDESVPPDGKPHKIVLTPKYPGLHRVTFSDGNDRTKIAFPPGLIAAFDSSADRGGPDSGNMFFYVPKGTAVLGFYQDTWRGNIIAPNGKKYALGKKKGYGHFRIPADQTGKVWQLHYVGGNVKLLTVPPQLSLRKNRMLLPEDAVRRDHLEVLENNAE